MEINSNHRPAERSGPITFQPGVAPAKVAFIGTDGRQIADISKLKVSEAKVGTMQPATQGVLVVD